MPETATGGPCRGFEDFFRSRETRREGGATGFFEAFRLAALLHGEG